MATSKTKYEATDTEIKELFLAHRIGNVSEIEPLGDGMYYTIVDVMVKPQYQGQKIGSAIVNRLVDLVNAGITEGGRTSIQLIAAPGKEGFYVKQGFKVLPNENSGPALRKVICT